MRNDVVKFVAAVVVSELAGVAGSIFTAPAISTWYTTLQRPALSPPNWVFGPVWTTLFTLMGVAAFLVWRRGWDNRKVRVALGVFVLQIILNVLWSVIFFGLRSPGGALIEIAVLWLAILATIITFVHVSRPAAYLLIPYLAWVSFATYLNAAFWRLNA